MKLLTLTTCLALAGMLVSCGGSDSSADSPSNTNTDEAASSSAIMADMGDFPIPAAPGANEIMGGPPSFMLAYPLEDFDRVTQFYDDWVDGQSGEYMRVDAGEELGGDIKGVSLAASDGSWTITVAEEEIEPRRTVVWLIAGDP